MGAALGFLKQRHKTGTRVLAGYSFGAVIALAYCFREEHKADHLVLVSPPPSLLPEGVSLEAGVLRKIIVGEEDEMAPTEEIKARVAISRQDELIEVIPGTDHFFGGTEDDLEKRLIRVLESTGSKEAVS
jgi:alpha/beta superfamily hydrolase